VRGPGPGPATGGRGLAGDRAGLADALALALTAPPGPAGGGGGAVAVAVAVADNLGRRRRFRSWYPVCVVSGQPRAWAVLVGLLLTAYESMSWSKLNTK
jgi:hypothetical protein